MVGEAGTAGAAFRWEHWAAGLEPPVVLVSTVVGRGMYTLGEALRERFPRPDEVAHVAVEDLLPDSAVAEDLKRYRFIMRYCPFLVGLVNKIPFFYYRKYLRESLLGGGKLRRLRARLEESGTRTVVCVSHRPGFWVSNIKGKARMDFKLWGLLGEYGSTLGWKYIFWDQVSGFLSPLRRESLDYPIPAHCDFREIDLPARRAYYELASVQGRKDCVLVVCGYWGQGSFGDILRALLAEGPGLTVHVVCGDNEPAYKKICRAFGARAQVKVYGALGSLVPLMREAGCVISKPGISTILEARAAGRKLFLVKGVPVAEDNNARYAAKNFGAEWFSMRAFRRWRDVPGPW
jgi:hypothetical protein